tara:strand:+ start:569 stop:790 length:222 start_codon:yes stop_codon:yes gene_type:complete
MPLYEYKCPECENEVDLLTGFDSPNPKCPECEKKNKEVEMTKKISVPSFSLKGGGWHKDHYGLKPSNQDEGKS